MKELSSSIVRLIQFVEYYLCPQYCGVVDRRRVIAYLFTTLIEWSSSLSISSCS